MLEDSDNIEQDDSQMPALEEDDDEQELPEPPEPAPIPEPEPAPEPMQPSKWNWIGSPSRPEAQEESDGISDLFRIEDEDDTSDLISVDLEKDIIDGDLEDLTEVSEEDILGDEETGQVPLDYKPDLPKRKSLPRYRRTPFRYIPPISMGGSG